MVHRLTFKPGTVRDQYSVTLRHLKNAFRLCKVRNNPREFLNGWFRDEDALTGT